MKKDLLLIIIYLIFLTNCLKNKEITLQTEKVIEGNPNNTRVALHTLPPTNTWFETYPALTGIPDSLEDVSQVHTHINYDQVAYQGYKSNTLDYDFISHLILKWGIDTMSCSEEPIYSFIYAATGRNNDNWYYILILIAILISQQKKFIA